MTKGQKKELRKRTNNLDYFLKRLTSQAHIRNPDVVEEIRLNILSEIDRLLSWEEEENIY